MRLVEDKKLKTIALFLCPKHGKQQTLAASDEKDEMFFVCEKCYNEVVTSPKETEL